MTTGSSSNTTQSTAMASSAGAAAVVAIILWLLSLKGITVPDNVSDSMVVLLGVVAHSLVALGRSKGVEAPPPTTVLVAQPTASETQPSTN